jgi:nucleotide-binding universal stress UspA family protein
MEKMKILIGYDGSAGAEAALADLKRAGLPRKAEVVVLSVAKELIPAPASIGGVTTPFPADEFKAQREALTLARSAKAAIKPLFPDWQVRAEAAIGSPASILIRKADEFEPDLVVVGSHGHTALGRFFFGSVSQKVLHEAHGSVRVARGAGKNADEPVRIVAGIDGSEGAQAAVKEIATRHWPAGSEARVVAAVGTLPPIASEEMAVEVEKWIAAENERIREAVEAAVQRLLRAGLTVSTLVKQAVPRQLLCDEAESWGADSIFVGAKGMGRIERMLIGSVSSAVAARAHCSVEVVR